jgi:hypothetical protein
VDTDALSQIMDLLAQQAGGGVKPVHQIGGNGERLIKSLL